MLQITQYNINLKLGIQKKHGLLITTERAWASARGQTIIRHSLLEIGTKNEKLLANLKSGT